MPASITFTVTIPDLQPVHWEQTLGDHGVPSKAEAIDIQNIITNAKSSADRLDEDIIHIQQILEQLQKRRHELTTQAYAHHAFLSPIRRLPNEILGEVFRTYCSPRICASLSDSLRLKDFDGPLFLGFICRRWRALSLLMPDLWSRIVITYPMSTEGHAMISCFLERSQKTPLTVTIINSPLKYDLMWTATLESVISTSERWSRLALFDVRGRSWSRSSDWSFLFRPKPNLPSLHTVLLRLPSDTHFSDVFEAAPALHNVHLFARKAVTDLRLPWHQLTVFSHETKAFDSSPEWSFEDGRYVLTASPQLISCTLKGLQQTPESQIHHVHHGHLQDLQIDSIADLSDFFGSLTLPALQRLELSMSHQWTTTEVRGLKSIKDLISRSSCHLQKLLLPLFFIGPISVSDLIFCLEETPELLELQFKSDYNGLTQLMGYKEGMSLLLSLCPRIRCVRCRVDHSDAEDIISLEASIRSQIGNVILLINSD